MSEKEKMLNQAKEIIAKLGIDDVTSIGFHKNGDPFDFPDRHCIVIKYKPNKECVYIPKLDSNRYRPFANAGECWEEMTKHQPFGWLKSKQGMTSIASLNTNKDCIHIFSIDRHIEYPFFDALMAYTFPDGTPFGIYTEDYE